MHFVWFTKLTATGILLRASPHSCSSRTLCPFKFPSGGRERLCSAGTAFFFFFSFHFSPSEVEGGVEARKGRAGEAYGKKIRRKGIKEGEKKCCGIKCRAAEAGGIQIHLGKKCIEWQRCERGGHWTQHC